jgi:hypothetical protein
VNELPLPLRMTNVGQCNRLETMTEFHAEIVLPVLGPTKIEVRLVFPDSKRFLKERLGFGVLVHTK